METPKKMAFVFGDVTMTITPDDIETIYNQWLAENPGKKLRDMPSEVFSNRCMERMKANAKLTRTVLHN